MSQTKDKTIEVHNIPLHMDGTIYEVVGKYDADAPDGYRNNQTSKLLDDDAGKNTICALFDMVSQLWDTGLYEDSPMYRNMDDKKRSILVQQIQELIVEPFEKAYGKGRLDPTDPDSVFWNYKDQYRSFKVDLYKGKIFDTSNPKDRLELFICIVNKDLVTKEFENVPLFKDAQFCIENKEQVRDARIENEILDTDAKGNFFNLLSNPTALKLILNYIGLKNVDTSNKTITNTLFTRFIEDKSQAYQNKKMFLDAVALYAKPKGKKEIEYYTSIDKLITKGKIVKIDGEYYIEDTPIGGNLKTCAIKVAGNQKLQIAIDKMIEE